MTLHLRPTKSMGEARRILAKDMRNTIGIPEYFSALLYSSRAKHAHEQDKDETQQKEIGAIAFSDEPSVSESKHYVFSSHKFGLGMAIPRVNAALGKALKQKRLG